MWTEFSNRVAYNEQGLACSTGNRLPSARQPMPNFVLMMKLRTIAQRCLSSPNKSNIEKQKLKHSFRPPVLRQTPCCRSGQKWDFNKNQKPKATSRLAVKRYFETRILREVIFTNRENYLKTVNRSAVTARKVWTQKLHEERLGFKNQKPN